MAQGASLPNGTISYFENVSGSKPFVVSGENVGPLAKIYPYKSRVATQKDYPKYDGIALTGSYPLTSSVERNIIISASNGPEVEGVTSVRTGVAFQKTVNKVTSLYNNYNSYAPQSPYFDFNTYLMKNGGKPPKEKLVSPLNPNSQANTIQTGSALRPPFINVIEIPRLYRGERINRGTVKLQFYYTGSLLAEASDTTRNGQLIETVGPRAGSTVGTVMYKEGMILLTASYDLHSLSDGYLSPQLGSVDPTTVTLSPSFVDTSKWTHFGSYKSFVTSSVDALSSSFAPVSSSYTLEFEGTHVIPTMLMTAHAPKNDLNWSNNPTYVERKDTYANRSYNEIYVLGTGSFGYIEEENIDIKNTISSSFCQYTASYVPQTYISKIGVYDDDGDLIAIAKLANPVRKTNEQDYTFKLKLDL